MSKSGQDLLDVFNDSNRSIADKCQLVDRYLSGNSDTLRGFFENCFPVLVKSIFGYDRAGWMSEVSKVCLNLGSDRCPACDVLLSVVLVSADESVK